MGGGGALVQVQQHLGHLVLHAGSGILGLLAEIVSGRGGQIDVSMRDVMLSQLNYRASAYLNAGIEPRRLPFAGHSYNVPAQLFPTAEGYLAPRLALASTGTWPRTAEMGAPAMSRRDPVALAFEDQPEFVFAVQAIWRLGAVVVLFSPAWKQGEVEHALAITEPDHAVGDHPVLAGLMPMKHLDEPITPADGPSRAPDPLADAVLVFSSGTTGLPKAVRHTHASLSAAVRHWQDALGLTARDRMQIATPPSHILGLPNIVTVRRTGTWLRLHRRFDLERLLRTICDGQRARLPC